MKSILSMLLNWMLWPLLRFNDTRYSMHPTKEWW